LNTLGQDDDFVTHLLKAKKYEEPVPGADSPPCHGWNVPGAPFKDRLAIEERESAKFLSSLEKNGYNASGLFPRPYCSRDLLTLEANSRYVNSPVWNIQTSTPIVDNHNDFDNPRLIAFLRQLYREAEFRDDAVEQLAK